MSWPSQLVLVRHAESLGNTLARDERAKCEIATHAYPISVRGKMQTEITKKYLEEEYGNDFTIQYANECLPH